LLIAAPIPRVPPVTSATRGMGFLPVLSFVEKWTTGDAYRCYPSSALSFIRLALDKFL
jgi:hypothetical protein